MGKEGLGTGGDLPEEVGKNPLEGDPSLHLFALRLCLNRKEQGSKEQGSSKEGIQ